MSTPPDGFGPQDRHYGVYAALVTDVVDSDRLGRIEVTFPWLGQDGEAVRSWATLLTPYADDDQGFVALPEVGTQVVVAFEAGELQRPYIVGSCWNGQEMMPVTATRQNDRRVIKSRAGSLFEFDDREGSPKVTVSMASGHQLVLDDGAQQVQLRHQNGCVLTMDASGKVSITANATVDITAAAVNVHAATATFDGIVTCQTLIANAGVISPSYTPGAGNVW